MADDEDVSGLEEEGAEGAPTRDLKSSKVWLAAIAEAEKAFSDYHQRADNIDKLYANLDRLANIARDREFQLFWANIQVLCPSIYARPPVPVVVPRFQNRDAVPTVASEMLERATVVAFETECVDSVMRRVRDDLAIVGRGCVWLRYETKKQNDGVSERVCIDHVDRRDFLHEPARYWKEVGWVGKASYLTRGAMRKRFRTTSGDVYKDAAYLVQKDDKANGAADSRVKAKVWEVWSKTDNRVVWLAEGCDKLLDEGEPHLTLEGFFPCPAPAYATVQRRSLVPVPDMLFYRDQLEEVSELTARIAALTPMLKVRGFYPAGAGELSDAIESAVKKRTDNVVLIGVSNWALTGTGSAKDTIVWLPLEIIASTIAQLVALRKQLIDDVFQISGLSDIMRGSTVASETLGAQQLKSQYGSTRIRDKQDELVRVARDAVRISAEIMAENFASKTLVDMAQMTIKTDAELAKESKPLEQQLTKLRADIDAAMNDPETQALAQQNPEQAKKVLDGANQQAMQLNEQIAKLKETPTVEKVMKLLRDQRVRPFVLDIETDSTVTPDENAQKQRATEYVTAVSGLMGQALPAVQQFPQAAPLIADTFKFAQQQFRVGRSMQSTVDDFVDQMKELASQPKPPDPAASDAQAKQQADQAALKSDMEMKQADAQIRAQEASLKVQAGQQDMAAKAQLATIEVQARQREADIKLAEMQAKAMADGEKHNQEMEKGALEIEKLRLEIERIRVNVVAAMTPPASPMNGAAQ